MDLLQGRRKVFLTRLSLRWCVASFSLILVGLLQSSLVLAAYSSQYTVSITVNGTANVVRGPFGSRAQAEAAMRSYNEAAGYFTYDGSAIYTTGVQVDYYRVKPQPVILGPWQYYAPDGVLFTAGHPRFFDSEAEVVQVWKAYYETTFGAPVCRLSDPQPQNDYPGNSEGYCVHKWLADPWGLIGEKRFEFDVVYGSQCNQSAVGRMYTCRERNVRCPSYASYYDHGYVYHGLTWPNICLNPQHASIYSEVRAYSTCTEGNPCSPVTGNKTETETDIDQSGLTFKRYYQSMPLGEQGLLGAGWSHNYGARIFYQAYESIGLIQVVTAAGYYEAYDRIATNQYASRHEPGKRLSKGSNADGAVEWTLQSATGREIFDESGRLIQLIDSQGKRTALDYDDAGRLRSVTDSFGKSLGFAYNHDGLLSEVTAPDGSVVSYHYDSHKSGAIDTWKLSEVTYPDTHTRQYIYDDPRHPSHLTGIVNEKGIRYGTYAYDDDGRVILSTHEGGKDAITLSYFPDHTVVTDAAGRQTTYYLSQSGPFYDVSRRVDGSDESSYVRDAKGWLKERRDKNGNITRYERNDRGLVFRRTEAVGTTEERVIETEWHPTLPKPTKVADPGKITEYHYDPEGRPILRSEKTLQ